jgi:eukaryotic-like serine/threonine-protein kinase
VLGPLASGGMAEVWLAKVSGPAGFDKLLVVKTIRPALAFEPAFVEMFFNEARVAALLNHPNCVQIFDVGDEGTAYIAMEFIDGFPLGRMLKRASDRAIPIPVPIMIRILMDAAAGLSHAHALTDRQGRPVGIVHRDVSPDNILISFSGQTKVVDFGIAKAATLQRPDGQTRSGTLKGKFGYMAPEYLLGQAVDGRADVFALGVVLYRVLTGAKPFTGNTDAAVTNAILHLEPAPPRTLNPGLPEALEAVVLRALCKDPVQRFESAQAMRKALERAVDRPADLDDVAATMELLWPRDDPERAAVRALAAGEAVDPSSPVLSEVASGSVEVPVTVHTAADVRVSHAGRPSTSRLTGKLAIVGGSVFLASLIGVGVWLIRYRSVETPATAAIETPPAALPAQSTFPVAAPASTKEPAPIANSSVEVSSQPPMDVLWNGKLLGRTPGVFSLPVGDQTLSFVHRELAVTREMTVTVTAGQTTHAKTSLRKATLDVRVSPWAAVRIDGRSVGTTPIPSQELYEGRHWVELSNPRSPKSKRLSIKLAAGEHRVVRESFE